jgi:hypothetical protein
MAGCLSGNVCIGALGNPRASRCICSNSSSTSSSSSFVTREASKFDTSYKSAPTKARVDLLIRNCICRVIHKFFNRLKRHFFIDFFEDGRTLLQSKDYILLDQCKLNRASLSSEPRANVGCIGFMGEIRVALVFLVVDLL